MVPGNKFFSSLVGPRSALAAVSNKTSLNRLCLAILSLVLGHPNEWSPILSLGLEQRGHKPAVVYVDLDAKAVLEDWDKFSWAEVEAKLSYFCSSKLVVSLYLACQLGKQSGYMS